MGDYHADIQEDGESIAQEIAIQHSKAPQEINNAPIVLNNLLNPLNAKHEHQSGEEEENNPNPKTKKRKIGSKKYWTRPKKGTSRSKQ